VSPSPRVRTRPGAAALAGLGLLTAAGCISYPQRAPGPLYLPEGGAEGLPEVGAATDTLRVIVQRDSDPVWVRRPGARADYVLPFWDKRERLAAGSMVRTGAGGRAEILWAEDASSVVLFDEARVSVGDPTRDQPLVQFHSVTHAILVLTPEDEVELPGGARLRGDPSETTGSILIEDPSPELLRVVNQAKRTVAIRFRDELLELTPGDSIDLPRVASGSGPRPRSELTRLEVAGIALEHDGGVEELAEAGAAAVRALEPTRVLALGVRARLETGERARFSGLTQVPPGSPSDRSP